MVRPRIEISEKDRNQIEVLGGFGLTLERIAMVLGISERTLNRWLQDPSVMAFYKKGQAKAEAIISKTLFEKAQGGDTTALIWIEKTRFGRTDKVIETVKEINRVEAVQIYLPDNSRKVVELENQRN